MILVEGQCKTIVYDKYGRLQCARKEWKDGYCKQHHPDTVAERRRISAEKAEQKWKEHPIIQLQVAQAEIVALSAEVAELKRENELLRKGK